MPQLIAMFGFVILAAFVLVNEASSFDTHIQRIERSDYANGLQPIEEALKEAPLPDNCEEKADCRAFALMTIANGRERDVINSQAFSIVDSPFDLKKGDGENIEISVNGKTVASGSYVVREENALGGYDLSFTPKDVSWKVDGPVKQRFADEVERIYTAARQGELYDDLITLFSVSMARDNLDSFDHYVRNIDRTEYPNGLPPVEEALDDVSLPDNCSKNPGCRAFALMAVANGDGNDVINAEAFKLSKSPFNVQNASGKDIKISVDSKTVASGSYLLRNEPLIGGEELYFTPEDVRWNVNGAVKKRFASEVEHIYNAVRQGDLYDEKTRQEIYDKLGVSKGSGNSNEKAGSL